MSRKEYLDAKEKALKKLKIASIEHKIDEKIRPILMLINRIDGYYTSSSCAGRIVLLQIPRIGDKREALFLGIWHRTISPREITTASANATHGLIWLLAQAPILHIGAQTPQLADTLVKTAVSCGFKNSAFKSSGKKIVIELSSTERLDAPIGRDGRLYCGKENLILLTEIANEVIERSQEKLIRFEKKLIKFVNGL